MGSFSKVLTVNAVLNIVLNYQASNDWRFTFEKSVPGRKTFLRQAEDQLADAAVSLPVADSSADAIVPDDSNAQAAVSLPAADSCADAIAPDDSHVQDMDVVK